MCKLSFALISLVITTASAQQKNPSIMFQDENKNAFNQSITTEPAPANTAKCVELERQVKALIGKPQRHYALNLRYNLECKRPEHGIIKK